MHDFKKLSLSLLLATSGLTTALTTACGDDGSDTETDAATAATTATTAGPTTATPTSTDPGTTHATTDTETGDTGDTGGNGFVFDATPPDSMVQLDRMGMPAVTTAVISVDQKDAYNEGTPADDAASAFVDDIIANVTALHVALDDDLLALQLTPCAAMDCITQAAPLVVPDTLQINPSMPASFPNGRQLADPVVDITLAVVLLDLKKHPVDVFAKLPLNPATNDKEFLPDFPYVALPH